MEREELAQSTRDPSHIPGNQLVRKKLKLEWIESEWFSVWLQLARREHESQTHAPESIVVEPLENTQE